MFKLQVVSSDEYINPVLQSLCADALLSISDEDSDWELNIREFMKSLDPGELAYTSMVNMLDSGLSCLCSTLGRVNLLCSWARHFTLDYSASIHP